MVKAEVKTPNKRKSFANNTPAKKIKQENGNSSPNKPFTPKLNKSPKIKQEESASGQKGFKKTKQEKNIKPFAGTKQLNKGPLEKKPKKPADGEAKAPALKKKRKNQFSNLITEVKAQEGTKNPETLAKLKEKIENIKSRGELTKTAKRKLSVLQKLVIICQEGSAVAAAKGKEARKATVKVKSENKPATTTPKEKPQLKKQIKKEPLKVEEEEEDDEDSEEESEEENSDEAEAEESDDEGEEDDDEEDDDDDEEEDDDDDDSAEEVPVPAPKEKPLKDPLNKKQPDSNNKKHPSLHDLQNTDVLKKGQKRFVLFVGNIPYDTTKQDLATHFNKVGDIIDIRIPTHKGINKPRGFGYIEVKDETAYEKCLSMHHSQIKGRRINVLYTQGGKKKGEDRKKDIKAKNLKLHALRKQGKLAGSVKETQKRAFRRKKQQSMQKNSDS